MGEYPRMRSALRILLLLSVAQPLFPTPLRAQSTARLSGMLRDAGTGEALPSANIRVLGTSLGTITNTEGSYLMVLEPGSWRIVFSYLGYVSDTLRVTLEAGTTRRDVTLRRSLLEMPPIVVRADAGDLAAFLIAQAIARKHETLSTLKTLRYEAYTRTDLRMRIRKEKGAEWKEEILGITETRTRGWWRAPDEVSETILARRQTANFSPATNVLTAGLIPDFNRDVVSVDRYEVTGPTAPSALERYRFTILDTLAMDGVRVYRLRVEPRTQILPLFDGEIAIAEGSWLLVSVDLAGNEAMNNRPLTGWRFRQRFARYGERYWLPIDAWVDLVVDLGMGFPIKVEQQSILSDYTINPEVPAGTFGRELVQVAPDADVSDPAVWQEAMVLPLTREEEEAYAMIEEAISKMGPFLRILMGLTQPGQRGVLALTAFSDFFRFNRVQGLRLGAGLTLREPHPGLRLTLRGGYGFADEGVRYEAAAEQALLGRSRLVAGASIYDRLDWREGSRIYSPDRITWLTLLDHVDPVDYFGRHGCSVLLRWEPSDFVSLALTGTDERQASRPERTEYSLLERKRHYRPNAPVDDGRLRSAGLRLGIDDRRFMPMGSSEIPDDSRGSWRIDLEAETSRGAEWTSDFIFTRWSLYAVGHRRTFAAGYLDLILHAGTATGRLPLQRMFDLNSGLKIFYRPGAFATAGEKEFAGDRILSLWAEHNFGSLPLQVLGIRARGLLDVDFLFHLAGGWTGLSTRPGPLPDGTRTTGPPVWEAGLGLGRVASLFRINIIRRLTQTDGRDWVFSFTTDY
jgi:hypothetical protein